MRKPSLLLIGLAALIGAAWLLTDARTRLTLFKPNGFIQSGSALGVAVGDTRLNSQRKLLPQGMVLQESTNGGTCFYRAVKSDRQLDLFFVQSWHGGMVCIVSRNERVEELIWAFQPISRSEVSNGS